MGAYKSVSAVFGIAGTAGRKPPAPIDELDWFEDGVVDNWLADKGCPDLRWSEGGNAVSGPFRWAIYLKGTERRIWTETLEDPEPLTSLELISSTSSDDFESYMGQFFKIIGVLNHEDVVAWHVLVDVS